MVEDAISAELRDFIANNIDSVGQLEALLLLRSNAEQGWSVPSLGGRLYVGESEAAAILGHLLEKGFVAEQDGQFRYDRANGQAAVVDSLAETYTRQLIPITNLIHAKPRSLHAFADAFKIKRDK
jgi:hypothetical protein